MTSVEVDNPDLFGSDQALLSGGSGGRGDGPTALDDGVLEESFASTGLDPSGGDYWNGELGRESKFRHPRSR